MVIIAMPLWVKFTSNIYNNITLWQLRRVPGANDVSILCIQKQKEENMMMKTDDVIFKMSNIVRQHTVGIAVYLNL